MNKKTTFRTKRSNASSSVTVLFKDPVSKTLFMQTMEEYSIPMEDVMSKISPALGLGATEPCITIDKEADTIKVEATVSDKGVVLSKSGYDNYLDIKAGDRYAAIQGGRICVFEKTETREDGTKNADIAIGFAPSFAEVYDSLNKSDDIDLKVVREAKK